MHLIYEVNLTIEKDIFNDYMAWLSPHIKEMLSFEGFASANTFTYASKDFAKNHICVQYQVASQEALDAYLEHGAAKMRSDGIEKFEGKFSVNRRVLALKNTY